MIKINDKELVFKSDKDLYSILEENDYNPELVVVEVDRVLVKRADYEDFIVKDNMTIEVFTFIGGG